MPERKKLKVELIRHTLNPEETVALGAKLCYSRATIEDLKNRVEEKDQSEFIDRLLNMGHESVLEHASFTFGVEGVSRVLLAQLTDLSAVMIYLITSLLVLIKTVYGAVLIRRGTWLNNMVRDSD